MLPVSVYLQNLCHLIEEQFNIKIQTFFNSHHAFLLFGTTNNELRLQFNAKQSSTRKLQFLSITEIFRQSVFSFCYFAIQSFLVPDQTPDLTAMSKFNFLTENLTIVSSFYKVRCVYLEVTVHVCSKVINKQIWFSRTPSLWVYTLH